MPADKSIDMRPTGLELLESSIGVKRATTPDSTQLQASILSATRGMPQHVAVSDRKRSAKVNWFLNPGFVIAVACLIVSAANILLPIHSTQLVTSSDNEEVLSNDELDFQELMLIDDELLFAQL